jgi:hypothetical protein
MTIVVIMINKVNISPKIIYFWLSGSELLASQYRSLGNFSFG